MNSKKTPKLRNFIKENIKKYDKKGLEAENKRLVAENKRLVAQNADLVNKNEDLIERLENMRSHKMPKKSKKKNNRTTRKTQPAWNQNKTPQGTLKKGAPALLRKASTRKVAQMTSQDPFFD
tara:strand:- start:874 stop:1239 length:366 start_codon:yes stop_codon:yes gene_type:complete